MAPRNRKHAIQYGGEVCGSRDVNTTVFTPAFVGEHLCIDETHPGPPYFSGGPLLVKKRKFEIKRFPRHYVFYHASLGWYDGFMGVRPYIPPVEPEPISLVGWGAKGIARTLPVRPIYQLGVSIGELKDLPMLLSQTMAGFRALGAADKAFAKAGDTVGKFMSRAKNAPKASGDAYLYGQFGLYPMLQDALFLLGMMDKLNKKVAWLRRNNGKSIRRKIELDKGQFSENIARSIAPLASCFPTLSSNIYAPGTAGAVNLPVRKTYQRRIWFTAKYRFYIPELVKDPRINGPFGNLTTFLLGLTPDAALIYKLMPWSWLLDWFSSVGNALSNASALSRYHTVIEYAYVMCSESFTYEAPGYVGLHSGKRVAFQWVEPDRWWSGKSRTKYEFRQREVANPFGFGVTFASLSAYQWSILAALGLSGGGKHSSPRA